MKLPLTRNEVLTKTNTDAYTPTADYHPSTKKYVDDSGGGGIMVQEVFTQTGAVATGTTAMFSDDTFPLITEGDEYMTLAITPTSATNKLKIQVVVTAATTSASDITTVGLFQDTTTNALAAVGDFARTTANGPSVISFTHSMTAGTTSETTFRVRMGANAGTTTFNGYGGNRSYEGVSASSIIITETEV